MKMIRTFFFRLYQRTKWAWPLYFAWGVSGAFGGSSGPKPTATAVAPPASLFPSITGAIQQQGAGAVGTATSAMSNAASGVDVAQIYSAVKDAGQRQGKEGRANIMSSMGASGMAASSDAMRSTADYELQFQANLLAQLQEMQFQNEQVKIAGAQGLMETYGNAGMAFAPTQVVAGSSAGQSVFGQVAGAATGGAMAIATLMMAF